MIGPTAILNEREVREANATIDEMERALSSDAHFAPIVAGLPLEVVNGYRRALRAQKQELRTQVDAYIKAKSGDYSDLLKYSENDLGISLIVARIIKGYSQRQLARRLGLKEQQIQRYESERYRSISLSNFRRIAHALGVSLKVNIGETTGFLGGGGWELTAKYGVGDIKKVIKHARQNNWFDYDSKNGDDEIGAYSLERYVYEYFRKFGSPALLRTGLNVEDLSNDLGLVAWRARVTKLAEAIIQSNKVTYSGLDISWLTNLVHLSRHDDGPAKARELLLRHGIVLIAEPQIPGTKLDGAAFLIDGVPVIGLTLRRDTIDGFWFTLLHEVAHVILHYRMGMSVGFFDDTEDTEREGLDEVEREANEFASNMLIPSEKWKRSPARISKATAPIEKFASELKIHPAIVFGRIQKERRDYATFSDKIGRGMVRKWLLN